MSTTFAPLRSETDHARHLTEECGATWRDLRDLGYSDRRARALTEAFPLSPLAPDEHRLIPSVANAGDLVTLVPSGAVARHYWPLGLYLRDINLRGQVRLTTTYLGTDEDGRIAHVHPITARWLIGSAAALPHIGTPSALAAAAHPDTMQLWPKTAWVYQLGPAIPVGLDLGFARNGTGGVGAIAGVRHHPLATLTALAANGGKLKGLRSV